jgi:hypothetical protein
MTDVCAKFPAVCNFQSLYMNDDGYVVRCKECGPYQLGFSSALLTLLKKNFM